MFKIGKKYEQNRKLAVAEVETLLKLHWRAIV